VHWLNHQQLLESIGDVPQAELEQMHNNQ